MTNNERSPIIDTSFYSEGGDSTALSSAFIDLIAQTLSGDLDQSEFLAHLKSSPALRPYVEFLDVADHDAFTETLTRMRNTLQAGRSVESLPDTPMKGNITIMMEANPVNPLGREANTVERRERSCDIFQKFLLEHRGRIQEVCEKEIDVAALVRAIDSGVDRELFAQEVADGNPYLFTMQKPSSTGLQHLLYLEMDTLKEYERVEAIVYAMVDESLRLMDAVTVGSDDEFWDNQRLDQECKRAKNALRALHETKFMSWRPLSGKREEKDKEITGMFRIVREHYDAAVDSGNLLGNAA